MNSLYKQELWGLYSLKAICSLFVVIIHISFYQKQYLQPLLSAAVPCFYMISGYFLYQGERFSELSKARQWLIKALILLIYLSIFYIIAFNRELNTISDFLSCFLIGANIWPHLWYLAAFWQALLFFIFVRKYLPIFFLYATPFLLLKEPLYALYYFSIGNEANELPKLVSLNFLFRSFSYIIVGYLISKHICVLKEFKYRNFITFTILCLAFTELIIRHTLSIPQVASIFSPPLAICLFVSFLSTKVQLPTLITNIGKHHSANIYFYHPFVNFLIFELASIPFLTELSNIHAVIVFIACIPFSWGMNYLIQRIPFLRKT